MQRKIKPIIQNKKAIYHSLSSHFWHFPLQEHIRLQFILFFWHLHNFWQPFLHLQVIKSCRALETSGSDDHRGSQLSPIISHPHSCSDGRFAWHTKAWPQTWPLWKPDLSECSISTAAVGGMLIMVRYKEVNSSLRASFKLCSSLFAE